ncbi:neprilysin-1 [Drosophila sulfurigaster albostrigata]|uniref:neprilysin-1 n=1 Tax=Drosophila sulfurigaster albostrigata TaxID=89887 RepID=UPI002D2193D7|nr:neprilysin-1 [Drosophila sulfurigaster albostrigata]
MKGICCVDIALALLCVSLVEGHLFSQSELNTHIQLKEHLISQNNDSNYVQRVMRLAKSAEMRSYMQPELDACENFYEYSCGNWPKINPANDEHPRETNYQQLLTKGFHRKQQKLLEKPGDEDIDDSAILKLKQFYASCLYYRQVPISRYHNQMLDIVTEFDLIMPALEKPGQRENVSSDFDWLAIVAQIKRKYGLDILLRLHQAPDVHNKTQMRLYVGQPPHLVVDPDPRAAEQRIAAQLKQQLRLETEVAESTAHDIVELESELAKGMLNRPITALAQPRSITELASAYAPSFNLTRYVEMALQRRLLSNETLYEHVPSYQAHLVDVLNRTSPHVLANYIFQQLLLPFYYERSTQSSAVAQCLTITRKLFPQLLDQWVYRHYADAVSVGDIESLWGNVKQSFSSIINNSTMDWLSADTRSLLLTQLNATRLLINSHAEVNFTEIYNELQLETQDYFANLRNVLEYKQQHQLDQSNVQSNVPHYDAVNNLVVLPVSLLQPNILWSRHYPLALRYGSLGTVLAQQLAHSFDNRSGWDASTITEFNKRKACFKYQYERLRYDGEYLGASDLQDGNIADNAALQVAFLAYKSTLGETSLIPMTEKLPNLNLSAIRLFFLSYAQLWCNDANELFRDKQSLLTTGIPNALRIQGALANFPAFASYFRCTSDSLMNPTKKCQMYALNTN